MSDPSSRLPARPSLEQLRKQARERLRRLRDTRPETRLAEAQHALAREYGFASWPALVHHVAAVRSSDRLAEFDQLARDLLAAYHGDVPALERLGARFGDSDDHTHRLARVRDRIDALHRPDEEPTLEDVRLVVARQYGFESWVAFAESLAQPARAASSTDAGRSAPPFYRIDEERRVIRPQPPLSDGDWEVIFGIMRERDLAGIATAAITDRALERLSRLDFVTKLDFEGAQGLSDDGLRLLSRMPQLEELVLGGWNDRVTDGGLEVVRHLPGLTRFSMGWAQRVTDAGVAHLASCDALEQVNLMGTPTGDGLLNALRGKRRLRSLKTGKYVTDAGMPLLHDLPVFRRWQGGEPAYDLMSFQGQPYSLMLDGPFTDRGLRELAGLDGLFSLSLFWHSNSFTGEGLSVLPALSNLGFLGMPGHRCDDGALRQIGRVPRLRMLMAQGTVATDQGFEALSRSPTLEYLWGRECPNLTGRGFRALAGMPALKGIAVSCARVDDAALSTLPEFPSLVDLLPMDVTDEGFRHVGRCRDLERLWCMYCRDTGDAATEEIAGLDLELYYAGKTRITDRSLEILGWMDSLESIELWEIAGITDAGIAPLAKLPHLREISVEDSPNVTRRGMSVFPPRVRVIY
jgi:hypothetical protein